jgi:glutamyl-tRNA reductase
LHLVTTGLSFRTAPVSVRERASVGAAAAPDLLRYLVGHAGALGAAVLSTCNRTDLYLSVGPEIDLAALEAEVARALDPQDPDAVRVHLLTLTGAPATRHLFRVTSGLESMVLGENQVTGQVKTAHRLAQEAGTLDAGLDFVLRRALSAAKRVRSETAIDRGNAGLIEIAVQLAFQRLGGLDGRDAVVVGGGAMGSQAAARLRELGASVEISGRDAPGGPLGRCLQADLLVCSTNSPDTVVSAAALADVQRHRGTRPLLVVDLAVPRDVDPLGAGVPGVTLVDVDQLGRLADQALHTRRGELPAAEAIISQEVARTVALLAERDSAGRTIADLARHAEELRRRELDRTLGSGGMELVGRAEVERLTESLVRKLLHHPISHLRDCADDPGVALSLRQAFALDDAEAAPAAPAATR